MERDTFIKTLEKRYAKGIVVNGNSIIEEPKTIIPVSPSLDLLFGGGVAEGSWFNLSGFSGVGKTSTALDFAATCQLEEYGGRDVYYIDVEGRLKKRNINGIPRLNRDKFFPIRSTEDKILTGHDFLKITEDILHGTKRSVVIIDSYSMLCHEKEMAGGVDQSTRGAAAYMILPGFFRRMTQVVPVKSHIIIGIVQLQQNPSGYGGPKEKGGEALRFQGDYYVRATKMEPWEDNNGDIIGQKITWKCLKTAAEKGGIVNAEKESYLRYGKGLDRVREVLPIAEETGLIEKNGSWYTLPFGDDYPELEIEKRMQGEANLMSYLDSNPEIAAALIKSVNSVFGVKK